MTSLVDLLGAAARVETVTVLGQKVECSALTIGEIADLFWRFPELRKLAVGRKVEPAELVALAPRAVAAAIAAATGHAGVAAEEDAAGRLPLEGQVDLFAAIVRLTAPGGVLPLVERLAPLLGASGPGGSGKRPATRSPPPSKS